MPEIDTIIRVPKKAEVKYERAVVKLDTLKTDQTNPNIMTEAQEKALDKSIERYGYIDLIVVDKATMVIANGEHRVKRLMAQGITDAEVVLYPFKDDEDRRLFRQMANKLHGEHDEALDLEEFRKIIDAGLNTELKGLLGMSEREMNQILDQLNGESEEDEVPPIPRTSNVKMGEVYTLGKHRLMCGDSTEKGDVEILMNGSKADMVFTDPPYGISYQSAWRTDRLPEITGDDHVDHRWIDIAAENSDGWFLFFTTWKVLPLWFKVSESVGELTNMIIWDKGGGGIGDLSHSLSTDYEIIMAYNRGRPILGSRLGSVWNIGKDAPASYKHPTQKPVALPTMAIKTFCGSSVLDLFGGSGSTLIACENTNRICYMLEIDPVYVSVILERWQNLTHQKAVRSDGVEWDTIKAYKGVDDKE